MFHWRMRVPSVQGNRLLAQRDSVGGQEIGADFDILKHKLPAALVAIAPGDLDLLPICSDASSVVSEETSTVNYSQ
jgi:hypothetical protein